MCFSFIRLLTSGAAVVTVPSVAVRAGLAVAALEGLVQLGFALLAFVFDG